MNPRAEAQGKAGEAFEARVLEPSPPAVNEGPWFADDPAARGATQRPVTSPVSSGDVLWAVLAAEDPSLAPWCRERWLGPYPALAAVPEGYVSTRAALHAVAEHVLKPAREKATGKIGLRYVRGGFGTPFFGDDAQVSVVGTTLQVVRGGEVTRTPLTSLAAAAGALGDLAGRAPEASAPETSAPETSAPAASAPAASAPETSAPEISAPETSAPALSTDPLPLDDSSAPALSTDPLPLDEASARLVGDWFGFAYSVLEELRARATVQLAPSRVQIWPEHFDAALELGDEAGGARAAYGCSPGDEQHAEPYLYVAPWTARPTGHLWNAQGFGGAELAYAELLAAADPRELALEFFEARVRALM
ncbi:MAG: hypothetical protein QOJ46_2166 [bacterium]